MEEVGASGGQEDGVHKGAELKPHRHQIDIDNEGEAGLEGGHFPTGFPNERKTHAFRNVSDQHRESISADKCAEADQRFRMPKRYPSLDGGSLYLISKE